MKFMHFVKVRVLSKPENNGSGVEDALLSLFPFDLKEEKVKIEKKSAQGFSERRITIYEITLERTRHTNAFIENLKENLGREQKNLLIRQMDSRLDDDFHFFIRLDMKRLLKGEYYITDLGECFHITLCPACFSKKRDVAEGIIRDIFK